MKFTGELFAQIAQNIDWSVVYFSGNATLFRQRYESFLNIHLFNQYLQLRFEGRNSSENLLTKQDSIRGIDKGMLLDNRIQMVVCRWLILRGAVVQDCA